MILFTQLESAHEMSDTQLMLWTMCGYIVVAILLGCVTIFIVHFILDLFLLPFKYIVLEETIFLQYIVYLIIHMAFFIVYNFLYFSYKDLKSFIDYRNSKKLFSFLYPEPFEKCDKLKFFLSFEKEYTNSKKRVGSFFSEKFFPILCNDILLVLNALLWFLNLIEKGAIKFWGWVKQGREIVGSLTVVSNDSQPSHQEIEELYLPIESVSNHQENEGLQEVVNNQKMMMNMMTNEHKAIMDAQKEQSKKSLVRWILAQFLRIW